MSPHPNASNARIALKRGSRGPAGPALPQKGREISAQERIWSALAEINDPEMPVNLVDLGLIYGVSVDRGCAAVRLTFTAMGCPATEMLMADIRERLLAEPGIDEVRLDIVWDPPWTSARLTAEGRDTLRAWGLSV